MENIQSLLVAIMFATILTLGIANILASLAAILDRQASAGMDRYHTTWKCILLIAHLNLFWHTSDLLEVTNWRFFDFLFAITGPILLFFATSVLVDSSPDGRDPRARYFAVAGRFFVLLALSQVWTITVDLRLGKGFVEAAYVNVAVIVLAVTLAASKQARTHLALTGVAALLVFATLFLRSFGVFE